MGNEGIDGLPSMTSIDWDIDKSWVRGLFHDGVCLDNVQGCDTKQSVGVVHSILLQDQDGGVDRVGNNADYSHGSFASK